MHLTGGTDPRKIKAMRAACVEKGKNEHPMKEELKLKTALLGEAWSSQMNL